MLWKIFFAALAIRWVYAVALFTALGDAGLQGVDSIGYLLSANSFASTIASGSLHGLQWLGPAGYAMPLFQWLTALSVLLFGASAPLAYVLLQGILDAGTCLLIYGIAATIDRRYAVPAAFAAVLNPTQIVLSAFVFTDTPFLFFVALFLFAAVRWMQAPDWRWAVVLGFGLGAATLTRALAAAFAPVLLIFLAGSYIARQRLSRRITAQLVGAAAIFLLCIAPVLWRNVSQFAAWSLTAQNGVHLAFWVAPLVKEAHDGTSWARSYDEMQRRAQERFTEAPQDLFEQSRRYSTIAMEELRELGIGAMLKAWINGAAINLGSPAIILAPPVSHLPRTGFFATPGSFPAEKIGNFLLHSDNAVYAWIILVGIAGVALMRVTQLIGAVVLLRQGGHLPVLCLLGLWMTYVLAINGPVASPKYRLPLEPALMVLTGVALRGAVLRRSG